MSSTNDDSVHVLGNGRLCAYERGADILQIFGPPYSAPDLGTLIRESGSCDDCYSQREPHAAIWSHTLAGVQLTDFVSSEVPCLVRRIQNSEHINFILHLNSPVSISSTPDESFLTCEIPAGTFFYAQYPYPRSVFYRLGWQGPIRLKQTDERSFRIECHPGESWLYICGGPEYPQVAENLEAVLSKSGNELLAKTQSDWLRFSTAHAACQDQLPNAIPLRSKLVKAVDDVAVLIRAQQSVEGGVLAGHNYHLCYVRDQYGVSRGLLALGHFAEAETILDFYWRIWQRHGRICNAQAAGVDGVFHIHENDEVEITGYLIRQAFDLEMAGCEGLVERVFPMLIWAYEAQKKHLIAGMLPFNGDETYIAGGILPRTALNDGSSEATLLFLDSSEKLLDWIIHRKNWSSCRIAMEKATLAEVRAAYRPNFWRAGSLITNNPARAELPGAQPRFRHGVCERCHAEGRLHAIGWTERSATGRYLCPCCLSKNDYTPFIPRSFDLQSVSLTPLYFHSSLFNLDELRPTVETIFSAYRQTGRLPSRPDDTSGLSVGYDYGFLLYALTCLNHSGALDLYRQTLSLVDSAGAWVEYYLGYLPQGTRCRPWESGINIEALLAYADHFTNS